MKRLHDKVAIITGAGSGIGEETARVFAEEGAKLVVSALEPDAAEHVASALRAGGAQAVAAPGDITQESVIEDIVALTIKTYGRIDVLHNNAAGTSKHLVQGDAPIASLDLGIWHEIYAINIFAHALFCKHVIPHMIAQKGGAIIMTSSGKGIRGDLMHPAYGTSKAALISLAQYVATMYGKQGIRANSVIVGLTMTEALAANFTPDMAEMFEAHHLTPNIGRPRNVAEAVAFLASDAASHITGVALPVDGGSSIHTPIYADMMKRLSNV
jgi:NAD(P)-dependent dehydrogenase (short-subunit alcohol dehydrogenase family)